MLAQLSVGGSNERTTSLSPSEAHRFLMQMLPNKGAQITSHSQTMIAGAVHEEKKPSCIVACILAIFFILPAIIYLVVAGKSRVHPFSIEIAPQNGGSWVVVSGRGPGLKAARAAIRGLPA